MNIKKFKASWELMKRSFNGRGEYPIDLLIKEVENQHKTIKRLQKQMSKPVFRIKKRS